MERDATANGLDKNSVFNDMRTMVGLYASRHMLHVNLHSTTDTAIGVDLTKHEPFTLEEADAS